MKIRYRIALAVLIALCAIVAVKLLIGNNVVALLAPQGTVASGERDVIVRSVLVMLVAAVPMLSLLFAFAWKYRAGNPKAAYDPDAKAGVRTQVAMWAIPAAVVAVLGTIAWGSAHALDPFAPIDPAKPPITIQVVALRWKWLFIYPEQHIATVNFIEFPQQTPVHFELTADGPVSSFWIPQLGSQIYAMTAMQTQLNLMASSTGEYAGKNMEINGAGYSGMTFVAKSVTRDDFESWVRNVKKASTNLDQAAYGALSQPSKDVPPAFYAGVDPGLYGTVLMKAMKPVMNGPELHM